MHAFFIPRVPTMAFQHHSAWEKILGSAQETTRPLQSGVHANTGQQVGPGHSYLLQQQPFRASTWRSGGTFSPTVPSGSENPGKRFGFRSAARWARPGARRSGWIGRTGATREAPVALLPSANTNITYVGTGALRAEPSRSTASESHLPIVTGVCFETNTHYRAAFTSKGSEGSEATKCHRPDSKKCWRTSPHWENYQPQCIRNFIAIREV